MTDDHTLAEQYLNDRASGSDAHALIRLARAVAKDEIQKAREGEIVPLDADDILSVGKDGPPVEPEPAAPSPREVREGPASTVPTPATTAPPAATTLPLLVEQPATPSEAASPSEPPPAGTTTAPKPRKGKTR